MFSIKQLICYLEISYINYSYNNTLFKLITIYGVNLNYLNKLERVRYLYCENEIFMLGRIYLRNICIIYVNMILINMSEIVPDVYSAIKREVKQFCNLYDQ